MASTGTDIELITLNCQGLRAAKNRDILFSWLQCCKVDILCLQETHALSESEFSSWLKTASDSGLNNKGYKCVSSPGTNRSCGVAILYHPQLELVGWSRDQDGRFLKGEFSRGDHSLQVCNIYGPNRVKDGLEFFNSLRALIDPDTPTILCGDFNTVVDAELDRSGCNPSSPWAYNWPSSLASLVDTLDLQDAWRLKHPTAREYTWRRPNNSQASRLDMFWLSSFLLPFILQTSILPFFRSDHSYVHLKLRLPSNTHRGRGSWKLNVSLLKDPAFIQLVTRFWQSWQLEKPSFLSLGAWWEAGKSRLRQQIQSFSRQRAATARRQIRSLENTLLHLQRRLNLGEDVSQLLAETKANLATAHQEKARGARIRAQVQWAEDGEVSSSYFFRLEKKRGQRKMFHSIRNLAGCVVSSFAAIVKAWMEFYGHLFTSQSLDMSEQNFFLDQIQQKLSPEQLQMCEGPLTLAECKTALDRMAGGKSPGVDGFPAELYQRFWNLLGEDFVEVMNYCCETGRLTATQRSGIITLLHKRGDYLNMKNWRPITLLCVDYKIVAKVLANRLLNVLPSVINTDQCCGVPGRNPSENCRLLKDIISDVNHHKTGAALLSLDQEKAFDRVEWSYLQRVLKRMNFGDSFCHWVSLLYTDIFSAIQINGDLSPQFRVSRGVRQGCPLSPLLYVIIAETIACAVRGNPLIDGYPLPSTRRVKICQYADDTSIVVRSDSALKEVFVLFHRYELASGAKLNVEKSHGLLIGSWQHREDLPIALDWSSSHITVMGSRLANDGKESWEKGLRSLDSLTACWSSRNLSFHGRALVANTLGLSLFWYLASFSFMPADVIKTINTHVFSFLWKKTEWLARSSVVQRVPQGGLGLIDIGCKLQSLHVLWIRRLVQHEHLPWAFFFRRYLRIAFSGYNLDRILLLPSAPKYALDALPPFYRSVMTSWFALKRRLEHNEIIIDGPGTSECALASLTASFAYRTFRASQRTQHRCVESFRSLGFHVDWQQVWSGLHLWRFLRPVRDTSWLIAHRILPTADRLTRFGMQVNPKCHCGNPETLVHLFVECPFAVRVFAWFTGLAQMCRPSFTTPTRQQLLLGYDRTTDLPPVLMCLLGITRHQLWKTRNAARFDKVLPSPQRTILQIKSSLRFAIRMQQRHCRVDSFSQLWLVDDKLGSVLEDGTIQFKDLVW